MKVAVLKFQILNTMKKLLTFTVVLALGLSTTLANAQTDTTKVITKKAVHHTKKNAAATKSHREKKTSTSKTVVGPTKMDGTADVHYNANKTTVKKTTTPVKP
jgi:hypothetical protein